MRGSVTAIHCDDPDTLQRVWPGAEQGDAEISRLVDALQAAHGAKDPAAIRAAEDAGGAATNLQAEGRYFGVQDKKGRSVGAEVATFDRGGRYFVQMRTGADSAPKGRVYAGGWGGSCEAYTVSSAMGADPPRQ